MLVLSRKTNEQILIGDDIRITLTKILGDKARIGIDAPKQLSVLRAELRIQHPAWSSGGYASENDRRKVARLVELALDTPGDPDLHAAAEAVAETGLTTITSKGIAS